MPDDTKRKSAAKVSKSEPRGTAEKPETVEKFRARLESIFKRLTEARELEARRLATSTITALVGAYRVGGYAEVGRVMDKINEALHGGKREGRAKA
jgi:hypothetical protein